MEMNNKIMSKEDNKRMFTETGVVELQAATNKLRMEALGDDEQELATQKIIEDTMHMLASQGIDCFLFAKQCINGEDTFVQYNTSSAFQKYNDGILSKESQDSNMKRSGMLNRAMLAHVSKWWVKSNDTAVITRHMCAMESDYAKMQSQH